MSIDQKLKSTIMSYTATVYKGFMASPGDLTEERVIARQVILDWNNVHAESRIDIFQEG